MAAIGLVFVLGQFRMLVEHLDDQFVGKHQH
jgi:hypothetical protein